MLSCPPAMQTPMPSTMICLAAVATAMRPEAHCRSMVWAATLTGSPAAKTALRAMFRPAVPPASTVPITASSICAGSTPARFTA